MRIPRLKTSRIPLLAFVVAAMTAPAAVADPGFDQGALRPDVQVRLVAESGFFATLRNRGEFGTNPSRINFREAAGQDNLLYFSRWSAELDLGDKHTVVLLYQPLSTAGTFVPDTDVRYADIDYVAGEPIVTTFEFPYYRGSYLYRAIDGPRFELQAGLTIQLRNANYNYAQSGQRFSRTSDVGVVPAPKLRATYRFGSRTFAAMEADGIYAPISLINGSTNETVGAILDASIRLGYRASNRTQAYFNVRYLGGGATNSDPDNYAKNWLHFLFVGVGLSYDLVGS